MGFFDSLKGAVSGLLNEAESALTRVTSKGTFERVCQAAYLVAAADGHVDDSERVNLGRVVARKLPKFKASEAAKAFDAAAEECALSPVAGKIALMANIREAAGTEDARIIMLCVLAVANADGEFDPSEKAIARDICVSLGLRTSEYGL